MFAFMDTKGTVIGNHQEKRNLACIHITVQSEVRCFSQQNLCRLRCSVSQCFEILNKTFKNPLIYYELFSCKQLGKSSRVFDCIILIRPLLKETGTSECAGMHTFIYRYKIFIISSNGSGNIQAVFQLHFHSKYFFSTTILWMTSQMKNGISRSDRECHLQSNCITPSSFTDQKYGPKIRKLCKESI